MPVSSPPVDNAPIEIRRRFVLSGDGTTRASGHVHCPRTGATTSLRHCLTCPRFQGFRGSETAPASHIACKHGSAPAADENAAGIDRRGSDARLGAEQTPVTRIMTHNVVCVRDDLSVDALTALFVERDINAAPVVDETGDPIGIVSKADLLRERYTAGDLELPAQQSMKHWDYDLGPVSCVESLERAIVADIMMPVVFTLPEDATVAGAAALMAVKAVHQLPILSPAGEVVGIVSSLDILRWLATGREELVASGG